jgi:hypothetical protein
MEIAKIKAWVAKDCLYGHMVYTKKPRKEIDDDEGYPYWVTDGEEIKIPNLKKMFPNMKNGDDPIEIELVVKELKPGRQAQKTQASN